MTMLTRAIPSTGEALPVVGIGTWQTFDIAAGRSGLEQRAAVLQALFDAGGSVIDSSPMYGRSEAVVGRVLGDMGARDKAFLATKVWTQGREAGLRQMEASLEKMASGGVIDLMQIHNLVDWRTHMKTLRAWKEAGRIRYIGITHYTTSTLDDLADIIRAEPIDFVQTVYSIGVRAAEERLLPVAAERGVAMICNLPFGSGGQLSRLRRRPLPQWASELGIESWAQFCLKYLIAHPAVTCVIPGTSDPAHAADDCAAGVGPLPDANQRRRMVEVLEAS